MTPLQSLTARTLFGKHVAAVDDWNGYSIVEIETLDENERLFRVEQPQEDDRPRVFACKAQRGGMRGHFCVFEWVDVVDARRSIPVVLQNFNPATLPQSLWRAFS